MTLRCLIYHCLLAGLLSGLLPGAVVAELPELPVGVFYDASDRDAAHAGNVADLLLAHHLNTVVIHEGATAAVCDVFARRGIAVITRTGPLASHPAVVATLVGSPVTPERAMAIDAPALVSAWRDANAASDKPVLACLPGDALGTYRGDGPWTFWDAAPDAPRAISWFGVEGGHYGILHNRLYNNRLPYPSVLRIARSALVRREGASDRLWVVLQAFGKDGATTGPSNPSPAEMTGMLHLAIAGGSRAILLWALQDRGELSCLVDENLQPSDGKLAAVAAVARLIEQHRSLLTSLRPTGLDVRCPDSRIELAAHTAPYGRVYLYAVNKQSRASVTTNLLLWGERQPPNGVRNVFADQVLAKAPEKDAEGYHVFPLTFAPGEGKLLTWGRRAVAARRGKAPGSRPQRKPRQPGPLPAAAPDDTGAVPGKTRQLLGPWLCDTTAGDAPLLGGSIHIDGKPVYNTGGELRAVYQQDAGAVAAWDIRPACKPSVPLEAAYVTRGVLRRPAPLGVMMVDLYPKDGKEHRFTVELPMSREVALSERFACDLSADFLRRARKNNKVLDKALKVHFTYFTIYPRDQINYAADTVLRPEDEGARQRLIVRALSPGFDNEGIPAQWQVDDDRGKLVLHATGYELQLRLLMAPRFPSPGEKAQLLTWWNDEQHTELRFDGGAFMTFSELPTWRTVFKLQAPSFIFEAGTGDDLKVGDVLDNLGF